MAVRLHEKAPGPGTKIQALAEFEHLFHRAAHAGDHFGLLPQFAPQQSRIIVLDRQNATRFAGQDGRAGGGRGVEALHIVPRMLDRLRQHAVGNERAAATDQVLGTERNGEARRPQQAGRRQADCRLVVVRERVGEQDHARTIAAGVVQASGLKLLHQRLVSESRRLSTTVNPQ